VEILASVAILEILVTAVLQGQVGTQAFLATAVRAGTPEFLASAGTRAFLDTAGIQANQDFLVSVDIQEH
jgi:hypothetical protein